MARISPWYQLNPNVTVNSRNVNDDSSAEYHGLETVVTKRYANGFALLAGYTYGKTTVEQTSLASPNALINSQGPPDGRRHLFKSTASYIFPGRDYVRRQPAAAVWPADDPYARDRRVHDHGTDELPVSGEPDHERRASRQRGIARTLHRTFAAGRLFHVNGQRLSSAWTSTT